MRIKMFFFITSIQLILSNCSSINSSFVKNDYTLNKSSMIKKIHVIVKEPEHYKELAPLVANIAADLIKLRTNYLVYQYSAINDKSSRSECINNMEGTIRLSLSGIEAKNDMVYLEIRGELLRCGDREVLWKAEASKKSGSRDENLKELIKMYEKNHKETADKFAAPAFVIIQDIVGNLPNPVLTDKEIESKIQLEAEK